MNIMIYINRELEERFSKEENKSGLVNQLLEEYYSGATSPAKTEKVPPAITPDELITEESDSPWWSDFRILSVKPPVVEDPATGERFKAKIEDGKIKEVYD